MSIVSRRDWLAVALIALACSSACDHVVFVSDTSSATVQRSLLGPGFALNPATGLVFVVAPNQAGQAASLHLDRVVWGKLVDLYDLDAASGARTLRCRDLLVAQGVVSDGVDYELAQSLATEKLQLTILHGFGSAGFAAAFAQAEAGLAPLLDKSLDPGELPPFTMVPRNAAFAVVLDDLLDDGGNPGDPGYPAAVTAETLRLASGYPPAALQPARVFPDPNHGDLVGGAFHSTRVIVDLSVSEFEALSSSAPVNALGLPEASTTARANAGLRIPTVVHPPSGQLQVLVNLGGNALSFTGNGSTDPTSPTLDVVRGFRSGGKAAVTGDPHNGFLLDTFAPRVLIDQACTLTTVRHPVAYPPERFDVALRFPVEACTVRQRPGDVISSATHIAEVTGHDPRWTTVRLVHGDPGTFAAGAARYATPWEPALGQRPDCALRFTPLPAAPPTSGVSTDATLTLSFSEPLDATSVRPFDTLRIERTQLTNPYGRYVVGRITPSAGLRRFTFAPALPLTHATGTPDAYLLDLVGAGITDLAGNPLALDLPPVDFTLAPSQPPAASDGFVLRFASIDEDGDGAPDLRGEALYDLGRGVLRARDVLRFAAVVDPSQPVVSAMTPLSVAVQAPLTRYGSKLDHAWRYHDAGFPLRDTLGHDIDVEGLWWQPSSALSADSFQQFEIALAHSKLLPDEALSSGLLPLYPASGLVAKYADNLLDPLADPLTVVHPRARGYVVNPADAATSSSGYTIAPWPLNRGLPPDQFAYWTWRDTSKLARGAPNGVGADTRRLQQVTGLGNKGFYPAGKVPTIGLPLLMEFRTFPDLTALGSNGFKIAIAINSSAWPVFRAFSSGGVNTAGQTVLVDPDAQVTASGGFNASGWPTAPRDNVFYYGQADFVFRVTRSHTVWLDAASTTSFAAPVVDVAGGGLPPGTQVVVGFRGASSIATNGNPSSWRSASHYDSYGDGYTAAQLSMLGLNVNLAFTPSFFNVPNAPTDPRWHADLAEIAGARFVQARISFVSNAATGARSELDSLGVAFRR